MARKEAETPPHEVSLVRIFLSSPGDVAEERTLARQFIDSELPNSSPFRETVKLELIAWDDPAARIPMLATETPQGSVNAARPRPATCDIVIVILWSRMARRCLTTYASGTASLRDRVQSVGSGSALVRSPAESNGMEASMRRRRYPSDLTDPQRALVSPHIPPAKAGGRPRTTDMRAVLDAILYLLRTGCQWRQLPADFPPWPTVHGYFRHWRSAGFWTVLHRTLYPVARAAAGRNPGPTVAIMDGQSVKTSEKGGVRGFDGHKQVKGRKRHILVDVLGLLLANRVEPANMSDPVAGSGLQAGLALLWPTIRTIIADAGHKSRKLAGQLRRDGWQLRVFKRRQRVFAIAGLTWIAERSFASVSSSLGEGL